MAISAAGQLVPHTGALAPQAQSRGLLRTFLCRVWEVTPNGPAHLGAGGLLAPQPWELPGPGVSRSLPGAAPPPLLLLLQAVFKGKADVFCKAFQQFLA